MSDFRLDQAFRLTTQEGVGQGRVVVRTANPRECALPADANAGAVLGVTTLAQPHAGRLVPVRRAGIAEVVAAGPIAAGNRVVVADDEGRVAARPLPHYRTGTVVSNHQIEYYWIAHEISPPLQVEMREDDGATDFKWSFEDGRLVIAPATDDGALIHDTNAVIDAIRNDAALSALISVEGGTGSAGTTTPQPQVAALRNAAELANPIGIAQGTAQQAGDIIPVLLIPSMSGHFA